MLGCIIGTGHNTKSCKVTRLSKVIQNSYVQNICFRCGLSAGGYDQTRFHSGVRSNTSCGSGMMSTPDQFCWYLFYNRKDLVKKYVGKEQATQEEFVQWLGGKGTSFSCNMYKMFCETANAMSL